VTVTLRIDIWSDVVCPWCYIGKRRLEAALGQFEHADAVEVRWHSFQLDPDRPKGRNEPTSEMLMKKFRASAEQVREMTRHVSDLAAAEGLTYHLDRSVAANTFDAHRLTHLAAERELGAQMHERLLAAHLIEGEVVDDPDTLVRLGAEVGVPKEDVRRMLAGDDYADAVRDDIEQARRLGITAVPFFVLNGTHGVAGAQPTSVFVEALRASYQAASSTR